MRIENNYSVKAHNTFGINQITKRFIEYSSADELKELIKSGKLEQPFFHIGTGSNLLFVDDYEGTLLHSAICYIHPAKETQDEVWVSVGAGTCWDDFVAHCVEKEWYGVENLSLIPGEVGSAAVQNIGAYGVEVKDLLVSLKAINLLTGEEREFSNAECQYDYRYSCFKQPEMKVWAVVEVTFKLSKQPTFNLTYKGLLSELGEQPYSLKNIRKAVIDLRESKLPDYRILGNAGSFFTNPVVDTAKLNDLLQQYPDMPHFAFKEGQSKLSGGWLIQMCGWKGRNLGDAAVYEKQALVLINKGTATGREVYELSERIIEDVQQQFGVKLHREANVIGKSGLQ